jgi:HAD superfamily hydrolase (TIGR01490 family)
MNLAIFDFCETITNFQTANEYCKFVLMKESRTGYIFWDRLLDKVFVYRVFRKLGLKKKLSQKTFLLKGIKGLNKNTIEAYGLAFVEEVIQNNLNQEVFDKFLKHIHNGDLVVINSGGYEPYLKQFATKYNIPYCFSTQFEYQDDLFIGQIKGKDCLGLEKVERMKKTSILDERFSEIYVYSDSLTDLPIFNLASKKIAVIKQSVVPSWCNTNFEIMRIK